MNPKWCFKSPFWVDKNFSAFQRFQWSRVTPNVNSSQVSIMLVILTLPLLIAFSYPRFIEHSLCLWNTIWLFELLTHQNLAFRVTFAFFIESWQKVTMNSANSNVIQVFTAVRIKREKSSSSEHSANTILFKLVVVYFLIL